jgi:hypothetical protein
MGANLGFLASGSNMGLRIKYCGKEDLSVLGTDE